MKDRYMARNHSDSDRWEWNTVRLIVERTSAFLIQEALESALILAIPLYLP
ncbi:MAG: hypothetical protein QXU32_08980 [Nitrososphaerales archaeon]